MEANRLHPAQRKSLLLTQTFLNVCAFSGSYTLEVRYHALCTIIMTKISVIVDVSELNKEVAEMHRTALPRS